MLFVQKTSKQGINKERDTVMSVLLWLPRFQLSFNHKKLLFINSPQLPYLILVSNEVLHNYHKLARNLRQDMIRTVELLRVLVEQLDIIQQIDMCISPRSDPPLHLTFFPFAHSNRRQIHRPFDHSQIILSPRSVRDGQCLEAFLHVLLFQTPQYGVQQCHQLARIRPHIALLRAEIHRLHCRFHASFLLQITA